MIELDITVDQLVAQRLVRGALLDHFFSQDLLEKVKLGLSATTGERFAFCGWVHQLTVDEADYNKPLNLVQQVNCEVLILFVFEEFDEHSTEVVNLELTHAHMVEQDTPHVASIHRVEFIHVLTEEGKLFLAHNDATVPPIVGVDKAFDRLNPTA